MNNKKKNSYVVIIFLSLIILFLIILLLSKLRLGNEESDIELLGDVLRIEVGEIKLMPYKINNDAGKELVFKSDDSLIARIDNQGYVYGEKIGETFITISFIDQDTYAKKVKVIVVEEKKDGGEEEKYIGGDEEGQVDKPSEEEKKIQKQKEEAKTTTTTKTVAKPVCSLKVSKNGTITATVKNATKYSFDKKFAINETEKNVKDISSKETKDYEGWKYYKVYYYVEGEEDLKGSCSIVVIEKCTNDGCTYEAFN